MPLHFTAFHPDYKMMDVPPTPPATLTRARAIALGNGLHHVYTGNVHDVEGGTTFCPAATTALVRRDWYEVLSCKLDATTAPARIAARRSRAASARSAGGFGRRRIPVRIAALNP